MKIKLIYLLLVLILQLNINAQKTQRNEIASIGLGIGLDHGGLGVNFTTYLTKNIGLFGGFGYVVVNIGFNAGVKLRHIVYEKPGNISPYAIVMYGTNSVVQITNAPEYNKTFSGLTFGGGIDFSFNRRKIGYWSFGLLFPQKSQKFDQYVSLLKTRHNVRFTSSAPPVGISIGYKIILK
ncbi:MAG: hypothetical protein P1U44_07355 [Vicingaceae bacterium]|jgi:hypothetical protein|nr:hypothetical protein [Flavobacteriales bacterium]MBQ19630.1 hypothetical protein [Flavobacteriales bacterium]MDF1675522.1 hypothetical protein [Vicingaceae bacterium]|tara:strand:- start:198158 stop:198697 length:540 start_codon:yes stop_codon:yes gene_type:complete